MKKPQMMEPVEGDRAAIEEALDNQDKRNSFNQKSKMRNQSKKQKQPS